MQIQKTKHMPSITYKRFNPNRYSLQQQPCNLTHSVDHNLPLINTANGFLSKYLIHNTKYSTMSKIISINKNYHQQPPQNNIITLSYNHSNKQPAIHTTKPKYFFSNPSKVTNDSHSLLLKQVNKNKQNQMSLLRRIISQLKINQQQKPIKKRIKQMPMIKNYHANKSKKQINHDVQPVVIINKETTNQSIKNKRYLKNYDDQDLYLPKQNKRSQNTYSPWNNVRQSKDQWDY